MTTNVATLDPTPPPTLVPPPGLVVPNPQATGEPLFCLFTDDWLTLQTFIMQALQLPVATANFEDKYGTFSDEQAIENCVLAMKAVQGLSVDFGDPTALMAELASNPAILQGDTAPTPIFTHIVWFATRLNEAATTYNQTLGQFETLLNPANCGTKEQCGAMLAEVLTGQGGLQSTAQGMVALGNDLVSALASFNLKLKPSTDTLADFTSKSSTFYNDVLTDIKTDISDVATYQQAADDAFKLWKDLTISAVTTSVGLLILTGGAAWPVSAVLAGALGDAAKKARDAYDKACGQVRDAEEDEQKKILLKLDLEGFDTKMTPTNEAAQNFLQTLQKVTGVWTDISSNIAYIANNFTPAQLGDLSWIMQAMALERATQDWKTIADKSQEYTANSLVTCHIHAFGDPLPQQLAA